MLSIAQVGRISSGRQLFVALPVTCCRMNDKSARNNDEDSAEKCCHRGKLRKEKERKRNSSKRLNISENGGILCHDLPERAVIEKGGHC